MNWKPKNATIGVPGRGFIKAESFSQQDLDNLIERAKRRNMHVETFLINCGLVATTPQTSIFDNKNVVEEVKKEVEEKPVKKRGRPVVEVEDKAE